MGEICCFYNKSGVELKSYVWVKSVDFTINQVLRRKLLTGEICCSYNKAGIE